MNGGYGMFVTDRMLRLIVIWVEFTDTIGKQWLELFSVMPQLY